MLTPSSATVPTQGSAIFTATYSANNNATVAWTLTPSNSESSCVPACGYLTFPVNANSNVASGAGAVYNAPPTVPSPSTLTLTITVSDNDGPSSATSQITIVQATGPTVSVSPPVQSFTAGTTTALPFTATVTPDPNSQGVTWSLSLLQTSSTIDCGAPNAPCGTLSNITPTGASYLPPSSATVPETVVLTATPVSDPDITASAILTINPGTSTPPSGNLTISPQSPTVTAGSSSTQQFTASLSGSSATGVIWTLTQAGSPCLPSACGSLSSTTTNPTTYTPPTAFSASGTATLTATITSPAQSASTTITIEAATLQSIAVTPTTPSIQVGGTQAFTATGSYNNGQQQALTSGVTWTSSDTTVATISSAGVANGLKVGTSYITAAEGSVTSPATGATLTVVGAPQGTVPRYLFEFNSDGSISTFAVVPSSGQLRAITYLSTTGTSEGSTAAALNPNGNVLYTVQPFVSGEQLVTYSVSASGYLSQLASSAISSDYIEQIETDPLGRYLWVVDSTDGEILSYSLDPATGVPGTQTVAASVANVQGIAADPTGTYLFSVDSSGNISAFTVVSGGTLTALGTPPTSHPFSGAGGMSVDPSGSYLYVLDDSSLNEIFGYTISSAGLGQISGSPFSIPNNGELDTKMTIDPTSSFLYALDTSSPTQPIDAFTIGAGGALTPITETVQAPTSPGIQQIIADPSGQYVFAAYANAHEVWTYSITQSGTNRGVLTAVNAMRMRAGTYDSIYAQLLSSGTAPVTFTPQALYVANSGATNIGQFGIAPTTGTLSSLGTSVPAGTAPYSVAADSNPSIPFLYGANQGSANISGYMMGANGVLSALPDSPYGSGNGPESLVVDPTGSYVYSVNSADATLSSYSVSLVAGTTGDLTSSSFGGSTDSNPVFVTMDPNGQFVYTVNSPAAASNGTVDLFLLSGNGTPTSTPAGNLPRDAAVHPSGRYLYVANSGDNTISEFSVNASTGALTSIGTQQVPVVVTPQNLSAVVIEPSGQYLFASDQAANLVYIFAINPTSGALTPVTNGSVATGTAPYAMAVDISGTYLYVSNLGSSDISTYSISLANGTLTPVGASTTPAGGTSPRGLATTGTIH
ncbi:MAG: beta-propeller fold lactonase family protein [Candidatus Acidiferrum sp.]